MRIVSPYQNSKAHNYFLFSESRAKIVGWCAHLEVLELLGTASLLHPANAWVGLVLLTGLQDVAQSVQNQLDQLGILLVEQVHQWLDAALLNDILALQQTQAMHVSNRII